MKHKVGQLVVNNKLGLGKVLAVRGDTVTVFFKDQTENPRVINVGVVPMAIAEDQSEANFDEANMLRKSGRRPGAKKRSKLLGGQA